MSRPKYDIDWDVVDKYLQAQCDGTAIAGILGIHPNTLYEACKTKYKISFSEYSRLKKSEGKELLRAKQFQTAMNGNVTMLIWLGKQYLSQKEPKNIEITEEMPKIIFEVKKQEEEKKEKKEEKEEKN